MNHKTSTPGTHNRFTHQWKRLYPADFQTKLIHIHSSEQEIGKIFTPDLAVVSDPNKALAGLAALSAEEPIADPVWSDRTKAARAAWENGLEVRPQSDDVDMGVIINYSLTTQF